MHQHLITSYSSTMIRKKNPILYVFSKAKIQWYLLIASFQTLKKPWTTKIWSWTQHHKTMQLKKKWEDLQKALMSFGNLPSLKKIALVTFLRYNSYHCNPFVTPITIATCPIQTFKTKIYQSTKKEIEILL